MSMGSLREKMLSPVDLPREAVDLRPWVDATVWVRVLSACERDRFEAESSRIEGVGSARRVSPNLANYRARLAVLVCCDQEGKPVFQAEDAADLGRQPAAMLDRIIEVAHRLNGMNDDAVDRAEKNSERITVA